MLSSQVITTAGVPTGRLLSPGFESPHCDERVACCCCELAPANVILWLYLSLCIHTPAGLSFLPARCPLISAAKQNTLAFSKISAACIRSCGHKAAASQLQRQPKLRNGVAVRAQQSSEAPTSGIKQMLAGAAIAIAGTAAASYLTQGHSIKDGIDAIERTATSAGPAGPFIFIAAYAVATLALIPASALTLAAGFIYGPVTGTAIVSTASTLGATLAFLVSRYLARPFVTQQLQAFPKLAAVQSKVSEDGAKVVFLLRLSPLVPFTLLNYALGVTEVPLASYIGTSWAGMLPGTVAYVYLGSTGRSAAAAGTGNFDNVKFGLYAVGAVATLLVTKLVADKASAALDDQSPE